MDNKAAICRDEYKRLCRTGGSVSPSELRDEGAHMNRRVRGAKRPTLSEPSGPPGPLLPAFLGPLLYISLGLML